MTITIYSPEIKVRTKQTEKDFFCEGIIKHIAPDAIDLLTAFATAELYLKEIGLQASKVTGIKIERL